MHQGEQSGSSAGLYKLKKLKNRRCSNIICSIHRLKFLQKNSEVSMKARLLLREDIHSKNKPLKLCLNSQLIFITLNSQNSYKVWRESTHHFCDNRCPHRLLMIMHLIPCLKTTWRRAIITLQWYQRTKKIALVWATTCFWWIIKGCKIGFEKPLWSKTVFSSHICKISLYHRLCKNNTSWLRLNLTFYEIGNVNRSTWRHADKRSRVVEISTSVFLSNKCVKRVSWVR
jgi:hypothetical protein